MSMDDKSPMRSSRRLVTEVGLSEVIGNGREPSFPENGVFGKLSPQFRKADLQALNWSEKPLLRRSLLRRALLVAWKLLLLCWSFYLIQNDLLVGRIYTLIDRSGWPIFVHTNHSPFFGCRVGGWRRLFHLMTA